MAALSDSQSGAEFFGNDGTFFPEYAGGEYTIGDATLISSRGLGDASIPRFNNPPELVVIKLNP